MPPWAAHHSVASHPIPYLPVINQLLGHYTVSGWCRRGRPLGPAKPKRFRRQHALGWRRLVLAEERKGWQTKLARQGHKLNWGQGKKAIRRGYSGRPPAEGYAGGRRRNTRGEGGGKGLPREVGGGMHCAPACWGRKV